MVTFGVPFRRILVLRVLSRLLSFYDARCSVHISSCIRSTSVDILALSFVDATCRRVVDIRQIACVGEDNIIMKG